MAPSREPRDVGRACTLFAAYARRLGSGERDLGEITVLAWAEAHAATALTDDQTAVQIAMERGVTVRRTLSLIARGIREHVIDEPHAERLVEELIDAGARFPFRAGHFIRWARDHDLLG